MSSPAPVAADALLQEEVLTRVGQMTRSLHDNLRGLGFDELVERAAHDIPDARDRLDYVAKMTEQAAQKVLNATDVAGPLQDRIDSGAASLATAWQGALDGPMSEAQFRAMGEMTLAYLAIARAAAGDTRSQLMDIMMAQDFQDLTGQVIKKVTELAHGLEQQLVQLLVDYAPPEIRRGVSDQRATQDTGLLNGPQINPNGKTDIVADQQQVDDLLDSLGF